MKAMKATTTGVLKRIKAQKSLSKTIKIGGKKYDKEMVLAARRATRGAKNVVVSMQDAKQIFEAARSGGNATYDKLESYHGIHSGEVQVHRGGEQAPAEAGFEGWRQAGGADEEEGHEDSLK